MKRVLIISLVILAVVGSLAYAASRTSKTSDIKQKVTTFVSSAKDVVGNISTTVELLKEYDPQVFKEILESHKELIKAKEELVSFIEEQNKTIQKLELVVQESNKKSEEILANIPQLTDSIPETLEQALDQLEEAKFVVEEQDKVINEQRVEIQALRSINTNQGLIIEEQAQHIETQDDFINEFMGEIHRVRRQMRVRDGIIGGLVLTGIYLLAGGGA